MTSDATATTERVAPEWSALRGQLIADRFVVDACDAVIDLATGRRVELKISTNGGQTDAARWAERCSYFATLHHRYLAPLVDYGPLGETRRFEAWACDGAWRGARDAGKHARARAEEFLHASGLTVGVVDSASVRARGALPVVLPDAATGYTAPVRRIPTRLSRDAVGLQTVPRAAVAALGEVLLMPGSRHPVVLALAGALGCGIRTAVKDLARTARLHGYVPLASRMAQWPLMSVAQGRSLLVLAEAHESDGWRAFLDVLMRCPKPHILLFMGIAPRGVRTLRLMPVGVDALVQSGLPTDLPAAALEIIRRVARRARGSPVRFANLLWERHAMRQPDDRRNVPRAAEPAVLYGEDRATAAPAESSVPRASWPTPAELTAIRRRTTAAIDGLRRGRHAQADRTLRQVVAAFMRRGAVRDATEAALVLATSLLKRGRTRDADMVLSEAKPAAAKAGDDAALLHLAILSGAAAVDDGRLDDAEALLSGALAAATGLTQSNAEWAARLAFARCLFWRGEFEKGWQLLDSVDPSGRGERETIHLALERSRLALGRGDFESGVSAAAAAVLRGERSGDCVAIAEAARGAAFAHLSVGDFATVATMVQRCVTTARQSHDPLLALRARLLAAEGERRQGRRGAAIALLQRVRRLAQTTLPRVLKARVALLADLIEEKNSGPETVSRHVRSTGLGGLGLFGPSRSNPLAGLGAVHDIVDILQCCHAAEEDAGVLAALAGRLRSTLGAAAVGFFLEDRRSSPHAAPAVPVVVDGTRLDLGIVARVLAVDNLIAPREIDGRVESGTPVRYGGKRIGALVARWTPAATVAGNDTVALLTMAAVVAAPALAAVAAGRNAPSVSVSSLLLGASDAMATVRHAVERAAPAPFAVLIQGESGSGKELVARALHRQGTRKDRPFCTLNCAALPDDLVESELFGHARGAFTGAVADRPGVFEEAHTGTLFLDEVGELSPRAQAKVLRTIQEGELRRVGENIGRRVDVRIVSATNRDLKREIEGGRFRVDLLYRLDVIQIVLPALRERRDDIPLLAEHFWRDATGRIGSRATLGTAVLACLARYDWPGNVRELQNVLAALAVRAPRRGVVGPSALPPPLYQTGAEASWRLDDARRTFETRFIRAALARSGGHRGRAAEELGVSRQGLSKLMARLGMTAEPEPAGA